MAREDLIRGTKAKACARYDEEGFFRRDSISTVGDEKSIFTPFSSSSSSSLKKLYRAEIEFLVLIDLL